MFDVIDFLESVGQDAQWRHADQEVLAAALTTAQIDPELRTAILARDEQGLQALLGQDPFCCYINPAKEDESEGDEDKPDRKDKDDKEGGGQTRRKPTKSPDERS